MAQLQRHSFVETTYPRKKNACLVCGRARDYKIHKALNMDEMRRVLVQIKSHYGSHTTENLALDQALKFLCAKND